MNDRTPGPWCHPDVSCPRCRERYPHASDYDVGNVARPAMGHQMYFMAEGRIALCAAIATATWPHRAAGIVDRS